MIFNKHSDLQGLHAPFGASKSSWLRYSDEKAIDYLQNIRAKEMGTRLHSWADETIKLRIKQPRSKKTIYAYINDAIGFGMDTEVVLFYSERFFGTADAISFKDNLFTNEKNCNIDVTEFKESYLLGAAMLPLEEFLN